MTRIGIVGGLRTPFTKAGTLFAKSSIYDIGKHVCDALLQCHKTIADDLDEIVGANVFTPFELHNVAREIALCLKRPWHGYTVSRACGSGLQAISNAVGDILQGQCNAVLCVGVESLSTLPPGTPISEFHTKQTMGEYADHMAQVYDISREAQEHYAAESHEKSFNSRADIHSKLICKPPQGVPEDLWVDSSVRYPSDLKKMASLKPAFTKKGTITAATASPVSDGAAAALIASEAFLQEHDLKPWAWIRGLDFIHVPPEDPLLIGPAYVIPKLLKRMGLSPSDIDLWDMHEAFAAQVLSNLKQLEQTGIAIPRDRLNIYGGSLALGHPFAATGLRMAVTIAYAHHEQTCQRSLLAACTAGGMGAALILES